MFTCRHSNAPTIPPSRKFAWTRCLAHAGLIVCATLVGSRALGADTPSPHTVLERFLAASAEQRPVAYRAVRRLEASSARLKATGWLEALTDFDPATGLTVRILAEGGSGRIRSVLKDILEAERRATLPGTSRTVALTAENYVFQPGAANAHGLVAVRLTPRRRAPALVDGTIFVSLAEAELVRVEGRLAKSPSFWTRSVDLVRRYERRGGRSMPVEVRSLTDVKVVGVTQFAMTYVYETVNGQAARQTGDLRIVDGGGT